MNRFLSLLFALGLAHGAMAQERRSLESVLKSDWKWLYLSYGYDPGCTGMVIPGSIFLSREGGVLKVYRVERDESLHEVFSKGRRASAAEFQGILNTFQSFFVKAEHEESVSEHFNAMPEEARERELAKYFETHGRPIGGFPGYFIMLTYPPGDVLENSVWEEFDSANFHGKFVDWIQAEKGE